MSLEQSCIKENKILDDLLQMREELQTEQNFLENHIKNINSDVFEIEHMKQNAMDKQKNVDIQIENLNKILNSLNQVEDNDIKTLLEEKINSINSLQTEISESYPQLQ